MASGKMFHSRMKIVEKFLIRCKTDRISTKQLFIEYRRKKSLISFKLKKKLSKRVVFRVDERFA